MVNAGLIASAAAAIAAIGSWLAARTANATAKSLAGLERDRRHEELAPEFRVTCKVRPPGSEWADLRVMLTGGRLERYDDVVVTILDDADESHWIPGLPVRPTGVVQDAATVWGPWQFHASLSEVVSARRSAPRTYSRVTGENWAVFLLRPTEPASWPVPISQDQWTALYKDRPVRVLLSCRTGYEPDRWFTQHDVHVEHQSR